MPTLCRASVWLLLIPFAATTCSGPYEGCLNSTCCANGNFGCKKKQHRQYAQCRPIPAQGCVDDPGWDCPGWELCAENYGTCTATKCCKDPKYGCYRRPDRNFAQCKPLPTAGICTDTDDWRCPGWELCADTYQPCTSSHCCADVRDACYQKRPFYAQCLRRGTCNEGADGTCTELPSSVGQCSGAYQDCHLTACCQREEDHCFLKNDNYGKCMPACDPVSNPDWRCERRELPSEKTKLTCAALRDRTNIFNRMCATQYQSAAQCEGSFFSHNNVYRPCVWKQGTLACEEGPQNLSCDCGFMHKDCPRQTTGTAAAGSVDKDEGLSNGETVVITLAILVIFGGCCGLFWFFCGKSVSATTRRMRDEDDDGDDGGAVAKKGKRRREKGYGGNAIELETADVDDL